MIVVPRSFKITVLISGGGTTLKNLIEHRANHQLVASIEQVISNNPNAGGLKFATDANIPTAVVNHRDFEDIKTFSDAIFDQCRQSATDLVVMGGFLRRVSIPNDFCNRVINIHPSLIPAFCGKGFFGSRVHQAVLDYGCKISGCTVHFVDDQFDHGPIIAQETVAVADNDTPMSLAKRVFKKECELYPRSINAIATGNVTISDRRVQIDLKSKI